MLRVVHTFLVLLSCVLLGVVATDNGFIYPPAEGELLYFPSGTSVTVKWKSNYDRVNLHVFQLQSDGSYSYNILLCT